MTTSTIAQWNDRLASAKRSCIIRDGIKRIHFEMSDGEQMLEEYRQDNNNTVELLARKWRRRTALGNIPDAWHFEVGHCGGGESFEKRQSALVDGVGLAESAAEPVVIAEETARYWQWRIRNLPYARDVYRIDVDKRAVVVGTRNRKYYKRIDVPAAARYGVVLQKEAVAYQHSMNTLLVQVSVFRI